MTRRERKDMHERIKLCVVGWQLAIDDLASDKDRTECALLHAARLDETLAALVKLERPDKETYGASV